MCSSSSGLRATLRGAVLAFVSLTSLAQPPTEFPAPTGRHTVGTVAIHLTDPSRPEAYTAAPNDVRELMIQVWYPATPAPGAIRTPYLAAEGDPGKTRMAFLGLRGALERLRSVQTHAYESARANRADGPYPLLIVSHGFSDTRFNYTAYTEELASHGYVVAAIDHTYCASAVAFPDGRIVRFSQEFPGEKPGEPAKKEDAKRTAQIWVDDIRFVLDEIVRLNELPGSPFERLARMDRVGVFGHSHGGMTAAEICRVDDRVFAGVSLDGRPPQGGVGESLHKPFLVIMREGPTENSEPEERFEWNRRRTAFRKALATAPAGSGLAEIAGTLHMNFCDLPLLVALAPGSTPSEPIGSIDALVSARIVNSLLVGFFDRHLKAASIEVDGARFNEVTFEAFPATH